MEVNTHICVISVQSHMYWSFSISSHEYWGGDRMLAFDRWWYYFQHHFKSKYWVL